MKYRFRRHRRCNRKCERIFNWYEKLGFGFITSLRPDILLIDETLGVGDAEFGKRQWPD